MIYDYTVKFGSVVHYGIKNKNEISIACGNKSYNLTYSENRSDVNCELCGEYLETDAYYNKVQDMSDRLEQSVRKERGQLSKEECRGCGDIHPCICFDVSESIRSSHE